MKRFIIFTLITISSSSIFSENDDKLIKRTIIISPVLNINDKKEYEYLADIIRDTLLTKLGNTQEFDFVNFTSIDKEINRIKLKKKNYINKNKMLDVTLSVGGDIFIITKYLVNKEKITITSEAIDILDIESSINVTVKGNTGIEVLTLVDQITNEITKKITGKFKKIKKNIFNSKFEKKYGLKSQKEFIKEKNFVRIENDLVSKYYGIFLETSYYDVLTIVHNSQIKYKNKKNQIVLYGSLSGYQNVRYTIFDFVNGVLSDVTVLIGYPIQINKYKFNEIKNEISQIIRSNKNKNDTDLYIWTIKDNKLEFSSLIGAKGYILYYIKYSKKESTIDINKILDKIILDTTWFKNAIDFSIGGAFSYYGMETDFIFHNNMYKHFSYYQTFQITPILSFSYYINPNFTIGFEYKFGYRINLIIHPIGFAHTETSALNLYYNTAPTFHDIYNELRLFHKIGAPISQYKFILEYGMFFITRFIAVGEHYDGTHNLAFRSILENNIQDGNDENYTQIAFPNYYFLLGPSIFFGFERRNKDRNISFIFGGICNIMFGIVNIDEYTFEKSNDNTLLENYYPFYFGINLGLEIRFNYNYFKDLK